MEERNIQDVMEEKLYSRNFTKFGLDMNPVVSLVAGIFLLAFTTYSILNPDKANTFFQNFQHTIITNTDWVFILSSNFFIVVCLFLALSRYGEIRIGGVGTKPEFSNFAWYSMLISAGMGIGLMFWSVGEPLYHSSFTPPVYESRHSVITALSTTYLHWGVHPWAIYAIISLALAYFAFNKKLPLSLRSVFYPLLGDKIFGIIGDMIDVLSVLACLFGLATSLGFGVQQINSGLNYLFGIGISTNIQVLLIIGITFIATLSVMSGLDKGVKFLSELNIKIASVFMILIFLIGPTTYIINLFVDSLGLYLNDFIESSLFLALKDENSVWQSDWTVFYLAWWISWSPFVGTFIARISKGRTIREFILAVLIVPSLLSFVWLSVFGGTAMFLDIQTNGAIFDVVQNNLPVALFEMINNLNIPLISGIVKIVLSAIGILLVISFFVTSSDSGSLVVDNITSGGKLDSPIPQRVFWACMEGVLAAALLIIGGDEALNTMQAAVISTGLPFAIILILTCLMLIESLHSTYHKQSKTKFMRMYEEALTHYNPSYIIPKGKRLLEKKKQKDDINPK